MRAALDPVSEVEIRKYPQTTPEHPFYSHMRPVELRAALQAQGRDPDRYVCWATVRNPLARIASLFMMARRNGPLRKDTDFGDWVATLDPTGAQDGGIAEKWYAHGVMSMSCFLSDAHGAFLAERVFRIEDQVPGLQSWAQARLGLRIGDAAGLPRVNAAPKPYDWRALYAAAPGAESHVKRLYAEDFERFG